MDKDVTIWFDKEGDFLEVMFEQKEGYFRETENDAIMEKIDLHGNVLGFSIMNVSALQTEHPLSVHLRSKAA